MENFKFTPVQLDALKEIFNIGAGNAATALSILINNNVKMTVPCVNIIKFDKLYDNELHKEVYGVAVRVLGEIPGNILIIFNNDAVLEINKILLGEDCIKKCDYYESLLSELGNILSSSYMNSIAEVTGINIVPSVPAVTNDLLSTILGTMFIESGQHEDYVLDIETVFKGKEEFFSGMNFYYIPEIESLEKIIKSIGLN
ncbi:chemotaxis protein CheC [Clostridium sp.]|uniref:chemotaxis protein CheC n=1 Tax=Clostridium sp. TaxID=1506 RepID=UPI002FC605E3